MSIKCDTCKHLDPETLRCAAKGITFRNGFHARVVAMCCGKYEPAEAASPEPVGCGCDQTPPAERRGAFYRLLYAPDGTYACKWCGKKIRKETVRSCACQLHGVVVRGGTRGRACFTASKEGDSGGDAFWKERLRDASRGREEAGKVKP
jgi:hypothetical protein